MRFRKLAIVTVLLIVLGVACFISFWIGAFVGEEEIYKNRRDEEQKYVEARISGKPAYSRISIERKSNGGIYLVGRVTTKDDLENLRLELIQAIGEPRSEMAIMNVRVE